MVFLSTITVSANAGEACNIPGKTLHWVVDYCMYLSETDDYNSGDVQPCTKRNKGFEIKNTRENRKIYKRKICKYIVTNGYYKGTVEKCVNDKDFIPGTVRNDGI